MSRQSATQAILRYGSVGSHKSVKPAKKREKAPSSGNVSPIRNTDQIVGWEGDSARKPIKDFLSKQESSS